MLYDIYRQHRWAILGIYGLNLIQEACYLLIPAAAGAMINGLLGGNYWGLVAFTAAYMGWQGIATLRRITDTVVFTRVYNQVVEQMVEHHQQQNIALSTINARMELLKKVVAFFEDDLPFLLSSLVAMFGGAVMLYFYQPELLVVCGIILLPSGLLNAYFGKKMRQVSLVLNNAYEKQTDVLAGADREAIRAYLAEVRQINIRRSNLEAFNFGLLEVFVFLMIATALYLVCRQPNIRYGDVAAIYGYIFRFAYSFDFIPHLTARVAALRDIQQRLRAAFR